MNGTPNIRGVVVCADDFGVNGAASRGVIELARIEAISATSCLVHAPYAASYARLLKCNARDLSIGLHLDLTEFAPGAIRASLRRWLLRGLVLRNIVRETIAAEIAGQLDRFESLFDTPPAFVDGHRHVHQIPGIRDALLATLSNRYGAAVPIRSTWSARRSGAKARLIQECGGRGLHKLLIRKSIPSNTDFAGAYDDKGQPSFAERMESWLRGLADGGLIMCHPELPARAGRPRNPREAEYCFLASPDWAELRAQACVSLQPFRNRAN